ncbi:GntR family transcriptional regulator [Marinomonas transparens]|uniref:GntR family transcriptional regulator n=1 Tax=Marinomonas transparens TaxID=2795388 RepID=A0A934MZD6_9GAMM|nr:GntR family transcriptional regulator [Marinomonas transparens]MBJ7537430.1 GntR family transcriptional regulator [Marinomonas transparens]
MNQKELDFPAKSNDGRVRLLAYEQFQEALLDGRLRPGQMVSQRELVKMLSLSIGALRELLPRLQSENLITVLPQKGIMIPAIDLQMIRDAFQMRAALEREAVLYALKNMPDETLLEQKALHIEMIEAVKVGATEELLHRGQEIDSGFHSLLMQATRNELLMSAYDINNIRIRLIKLDRIRLNSLTLPAAFGDHLKVIDALLARDRNAAMEAMDSHIGNARERALEL